MKLKHLSFKLSTKLPYPKFSQEIEFNTIKLKNNDNTIYSTLIINIQNGNIFK